MHEVRVIDNRREAPDAHTLILEKPEGFSFKAGQYVLLQIPINGRPLRRSYSLASAPHEKELHITIRTQEQGRVSPTLAKLQTNDQIGVLGPVGEFTRGEEKHSVFVAAGAGITPFISMLREAKKQNNQQRTTILYTNKTPQQELYSQELEIHAQQANTTLHKTITRPLPGYQGRTGRLNKQDLQEHLNDNTVYYLCGSNDMVRAFTTKLLELGATPEQIRTENYGNIHA